jgi:hypothetical protein
MLCPKKGGAMKPTNIFTSTDNYLKYNSNSSNTIKKASKKHHNHHLNQCMSENLIPLEGLTEKRFISGENEDKNLSLSILLTREFNYQSDLREKNERMRETGESI